MRRAIAVDGVPTTAVLTHAGWLDDDVARRLYYATRDRGWTPELMALHDRKVGAVFRTVDHCERYDIVEYPPVHSWRVPVMSRASLFASPSELPLVGVREYVLRHIEHDDAKREIRCVYEEQL
jgi:hypothetical protein